MIAEATPVPVTIELPRMIVFAWIGTITVAIAGISVIWRFVVKASRLVSDIDQYGSVLKQIAKEFKSDSGSTLKDSINRIEKAAQEAKASASVAYAMSENLQRLVINKNEAPQPTKVEVINTPTNPVPTTRTNEA